MNQDFVGVIVDAGHGGIDSGAVGNGLEEKDLNLQAANYMYQRLQELGIPAKMTRTDDEYLPKSERIERVLSLYNNSPNTILVANHINAGNGEGAEIVYSLKNDDTLAQMALDNIGEAGQIKRKVYQRRLPENPNKDYYYILRETGNTEPILVEYGFIDNDADALKLKNNLNDYVEGVVKAIADYIGYPYSPPGSSGSTDENTYVVKKGDTLYKIAAMFGLSVDELKKINNLTSNTLQIGQVLKIKQDSIGDDTDSSVYTVKKNDTLYGIANMFGTTVDLIKKLNGLTSNVLYIGQKLLIPSSGDDFDNDNSGENVDEYDIYVVVKGDSLWKIANSYGITVDELIKMNNLTDLTLQIGDQLKVPVTGNVSDKNIYVVKKGDTLWSIARENGLTVDELKKLNNLSSNLLSLGQELIIKK